MMDEREREGERVLILTTKQFIGIVEGYWQWP